MKNVLLAGATGYLGNFILHELLKQNYKVKVIARKPEKIKEQKADVIQAEITKPETLDGCCENMDIVITSVGITRQRDGMTYMDVDYQGNLNLLTEAKKSRVKKFIYVSVLKGDELTELKICEAKEKFVGEVENSGLKYCIIRPSGFFSDMGDFFEMAKKGKVYLFGDGQYRFNPIHGEDLAEAIVKQIDSDNKVLNIGGPEVMIHDEIAGTAFKALGKEPKISHIPLWVVRMILFLIRTFTGVKTYGPIEFFMTVLTKDAPAPTYGKHTLLEHFTQLANKEAN